MHCKLQYISQGITAREQEAHILRALDHGAGWIQVRWKNASEKDLFRLCEKVRRHCLRNQAVCIINDHVMVAKETDADGVHLGLRDTATADARAVLGSGKIIGGTANTLSDVLQRVSEGCDYIGLGPFRFTLTKEELSPVLGLEGYRELIDKLNRQNLRTPPVYAIGGITPSDIRPLLRTGIYGIAMSGMITQNPDLIPEIIKQLQ